MKNFDPVTEATVEPSETSTEAGVNKTSYADIPNDAQLRILSFLGNKDLLKAATLDKKTRALVDIEKENRDLKAISSDNTYFILGGCVEITRRKLTSIYYSAPQEVTLNEIIKATPKPNNQVKLFRTREEAELAAYSSDDDPTSSVLRQVVFEVKLKGTQALHNIDFKEEQRTVGIVAKRAVKFESASIIFDDSFDVLKGYINSKEYKLPTSSIESAVGNVSDLWSSFANMNPFK
ncbi:F-box domain-containing protein [Legionella genomosp. 1]|uniref:F-box domain-containing protein n=1 Tax=Legionella genomosp. 1 TaxID=1093625 RepID=UPI001055EF9C|nr:F-box domain-containing protein [Legionella genomosp. 1]